MKEKVLRGLGMEIAKVLMYLFLAAVLVRYVIMIMDDTLP